MFTVATNKLGYKYTAKYLNANINAKNFPKMNTIASYG